MRTSPLSFLFVEASQLREVCLDLFALEKYELINNNDQIYLDCRMLLEHSSIRPSTCTYHGPTKFGAHQIVPSAHASAAHVITPIPLQSKEHLGILNGTTFSASVAALALNDAVHLTLLAQICTAMGAEALMGSRGSFDRFIHDVARPHPGQVTYCPRFSLNMCMTLLRPQIESARLVWNLLENSKLPNQRSRKSRLQKLTIESGNREQYLLLHDEHFDPQLPPTASHFPIMPRRHLLPNNSPLQPMFLLQQRPFGSEHQYMAVSGFRRFLCSRSLRWPLRGQWIRIWGTGNWPSGPSFTCPGVKVPSLS
jgi:hypothetical protein